MELFALAVLAVALWWAVNAEAEDRQARIESDREPWLPMTDPRRAEQIRSER